MSKKIKLYPYGFIFTKEVISSVPEQYSSEIIMEKYNYHYDSIYKPGIYQTESSFIIIHGHFTHASFGENINNEDLPQYLLDKYVNNYDDFLNTLDFIAGRFVIIVSVNDSIRIYPDSANARSTYYTLDKLIIASHTNLIKDNFDYDKDPIHEKVPLLSVTLDYSPYLKIRRALPNYYVDMDTFKATRFYPRAENKYRQLDENQRLDMIEHLWKSQLKYYTDNYDYIALSLSGGNDSRLSLAMAREYNKKIRTFTYTTTENDPGESGKFSKAMSIDQYVVKQILKDIDLNHRFFYFSNKTKGLSETDREILNKNTIKHHGRALLPHYLKAFPEENVLHIRTTVLEISTAYYHKKDRKDDVSSAKGTMRYGFRKFFDLVGEKVIDNKLDEALERLKYGESSYDYHVMDLYFWENRIGAWHTEVLNETDIAFDTLLPFNHRALIEIACSFPVAIRRTEEIYKELINRTHPALNFYGFNEKPNLFEQHRDLIKSQNISDYESDVIKNFTVVNTKQESNNIVKETRSALFIPENQLEKNNFSEATFTFKLDHGVVILDVHSKFLSNRGKKYLQYEILKNGEKLLTEDVADWNIPNKINIMNMEKGDKISVRVVALKNAKAKSWENASRLFINEYKELTSNKKSNIEITCTSPYSII